MADELVYANYQVEALQKDLQASLEQLEMATTSITNAEREADVLRHANALLRESERHRQDEIASLQADLAFYRRLGGANGSQAALAVHHMELQATRSPRVFLLAFTLTQNLRWASGISGQVLITVDGIQNDVARQLDDQRLLAETADPLKFNFKYFQQFEHLITLPDGFSADRLTIRLTSRGLRTDVERSTRWEDMFIQKESSEVSGLTDNPDDED